MKSAIPFLLFCAGSLAWAAEPLSSPATGGIVTLPLEDVFDLVAKGERRPDPPLPFAVTSARWSFRLDGGNPSAVAEMNIVVLADGWTAVPLVRTALALKPSDERSESIGVRDGMLCLLASGPGVKTVRLEFDVPTEAIRAGAKPIELHLPSVAAGDVEVVSRPSDLRAVVSAGNVSSGNRAAIPLEGGRITVRFVKDASVHPTEWTADVGAVVTQHDGWLESDVRMRLAGRDGNGIAATLEIPAASEDVTIEGADIADFHVEREQGGTFARVRWETPDVLSREIIVRYRIPLPDGAKAWEIQLPEVEGGMSGEVRAVVAAQPGITLSGSDGEIVSDALAWPAFAADRATNAPVFLARKASFRIEAKRLARVAVDTSRVAAARFETRIVSDGAMLSNAVFEIRHRGAMRWRFALPDGAELLTCEVGGNPREPLALEAGGLELSLDGAGEGESASEVRLSFTGRLERVAPIEGRLALRSPSTPSFVDEIAWLVRLPDGYEATAFDGNVEPGGEGEGLLFRKRFVRGDAAAVDIHYRRRVGDN